MNPIISLISTVHNRVHYLGDAIESVLAQTYSDFELLIWDDGSTDGSLEVAQRYARLDARVRVFAAPHQGRAPSLKAAHAEATGDYLGWIDSDDALSPNALEETAAVLSARPTVGMVYTDYQVMDAKGELKSNGVRCRIPFSPEQLLQDFMTFHFRLIRRTVFEAAGGIDASIPVAVDYDLCLRLSEVTEIGHLQKSLYQYRVHSESISQAQQLRQIYWSKESISRALSRRGLATEWAVDVQVLTSAQGDHQGQFSLVRLGQRKVQKPVSSLPSWIRRVGQALTVLNLSLTVSSHPVWAMPVPNADGTGTQVNRNGNRFDITGGTQSSNGRNLFHSLERLDLNANQIANFVSRPGIQNILGRINGGDASIIDGLLQVSGGDSNLYLLNPSGILFGNNATLNVPAAFTAMTANGIQFGNGWFSATGVNAYSSLNGAPVGFAFSGTQSSSIVNAGNLTVGTGEDLSLLGGTVVSTGQLNAPGGEITVSSVPESRYVRLSQPGQLLSLEVLPLTESATQPNASTLPTASLPQLLTGAAPVVATGVKVGVDGAVLLTGSDVAVESGDVTVRTAVARTAAVSAAKNLSLFESQIQTAADLTLAANNTVTVRDSFSNGVNIRSGGNLTVQGNQGIDISALNFFTNAPDFTSDGNLDLVSDGVIKGDASFESQGNIAFVNLDRMPGDFANEGQTTLQSSGVVDLGNYSGVSLKVEANGSIRAGDITITGPDTFRFSSDEEPDPDFETLSNFPALILRAGLTEPASIISVGDVTARGGIVDLSANGNIFTGNIDVSSDSIPRDGGNIQLSAFNIFTGNLSSRGPTRALSNGNVWEQPGAFGSLAQPGRITLEASGLVRAGDIDTSTEGVGGLTGRDPSGGDVTITGTDVIVGNIDTHSDIEDSIGIYAYAFDPDPFVPTFKGGDVTITASNTTIGDIDTHAEADIDVWIVNFLLREGEASLSDLPPSIPGREGEHFITQGGDVTITTNAPLQVGSLSVSGGRQGTITINELGFPEPEGPDLPAPDDEGVPPEEPPVPDDGGEVDLPIEEPDSAIPDSEGENETLDPVPPTSDNGGPISGNPGRPTPDSGGETEVPGMPPSDGDGDEFPNLDRLDNFTLTDAAISDPADKLSEIPEFSQEELERVRKKGTVIDLVEARQRLLLFIEARKLAGQRWTAQEIAQRLNIPLEIAQIAVLNPVGDNIEVSEPDLPLVTDGLIYAGAWSESIDGIEIFCDGLCKVIVFGVVVGYNLAKEAAEALVDYIFQARSKSSEDGERDGSQDKKLSDGEAEKLKQAGLNPEEIKKDIVGRNRGGRFDLYKDKKGSIYVKPKGGRGPGEPTGYNINDF